MKLPTIGSIGMRSRLIALVAFAMVPLTIAFVCYLWVDHNQTIAAAKNDVYAAATLAAATESRVFDETRTLLEALALVPAVVPTGGEACSSLIRRIKTANPLYNTVGVVDAAGTITCHNSLTVRQALSDVDLRDRMMAPEAAQFVVGNFVIGKVSGKPTVITASGFPRVRGGFAGAVFASLNLDRMTAEIEAVSDGGKRTVLLLEPDSGRIIVHYPPLLGVPFGAPFPGHPLTAAVRNMPGGGTAEVAGIDGADKVFGFAPLSSAGNIVLAVGEDRSSVMAPVRHRLMLSSVGLLTLLLVATSAVWWISERMQLRPLRRLMDAATGIGSGDFAATADLEPWQAPELRKLGRVLDAMSRKLSIGREAELVVAASEARFRALAENTADLITWTDTTGRRVYVSPASRDVLGCEPVELINMRPRDLAHPDDVGIVDAMMAEVLAGRAVAGVQYRVAHRGGGFRWVEVAGKPLEAGAGTVFVMRDFTSRKMMESQLAEANLKLEKLASTDGLTGLANRRALDKQLDTEFARAVRAKTDLSFLLIDVDSFKAFNDTYGHPAGDECLRRIAEALEGNLRRPGDFTARYGGEELAAVMPATSAAGAFERAEVVRQAVRELAIPHSGSSHGVVTISAGVATLTAGAGAELRDLAGLIQSADVALYGAKAKGRDNVVAAAA
ncbi:diguanylate cyclase [Aurantimonas endophytica]|uniref:diguanylate cyclase n=1 Tax=Aurantimonas endophytica TaxID=1522175 RepID=A0A7W6HGI8_9HYPH|nr:diguanylate cyclase [Aurantimonas endophytica]MBB4004606.1 diguanylate cyclase (GGDEF)-like protein/PAS domain S-box-containing protein [Aurantimonas endophytica]MCO6405442.1 diguanylate cyclase [Aurantimonas endophytica]